MDELANWKPGMALPEIPVEEVSEEVDRHLRETNFQVLDQEILNNQLYPVLARSQLVIKGLWV